MSDPQHQEIPAPPQTNGSEQPTLLEQITAQTTLVNDLRLADNTSAALKAAKDKLGELKRAMAAAAKAAGVVGGEKKEAGLGKEKMLLKTAKGSRDYGPSEMLCRLHIESVIKECFSLYGGSCLDTPVFERLDVLSGKYGEENSKLIFELKDQGGEELALRYDHTVPLARYLAMGGTTGKLWQLGKVYRRDQPVMSKGRMREFGQADFDIAGVYDPMIPDAEIVSLICNIFRRLDVGAFTVKVNHRKVLDGVFEVCGVPADKIRTISSAVDKLDKTPWEAVRKEMTVDKGLEEATADKIGEYVKLKGGKDLLEKLKADTSLVANANATAGLADMELFFKYIEAFGVLEHVSFDLSLARGLDYYTGLIYEAINDSSPPPSFKPVTATRPSSPTKANTQAVSNKRHPADDEDIDPASIGVGSIGGGGRYDNLVTLFSASASKKPIHVPCVGVCIGLDRVFAIVYPKWIEQGRRNKDVDVYVMAAGDGLVHERIALVQSLRLAGLKADFMAKEKPKLQAQFAAGEREEVPFAIILGAEELKDGLVTVKEQRWAFDTTSGKKAKVESADKGKKVSRDELVSYLKERKAVLEDEEARSVASVLKTV